MNLLLAILWGFLFFWNIFGMAIGCDPSWISVLVPTFCLAYDNFVDYLVERKNKEKI